MPNIRPIKPKWSGSNDSAVAESALGEFSVCKNDHGLWIAQLNGSSFPVLYETKDTARESAEYLARTAGHPKDIPFTWVATNTGGIYCVTIPGVYYVVKSETIEGFFVMDGAGPAQIQMATEAEAKDACAQYIMFVWYSLSEAV